MMKLSVVKKVKGAVFKGWYLALTLPVITLAESSDDILTQGINKVGTASEQGFKTIVKILMWLWLLAPFFIFAFGFWKAWQAKTRKEAQGGQSGTGDFIKEMFMTTIPFWFVFALYTVLLIVMGINPLTAIQQLFSQTFGTGS
jgi:heme/copper-type cytochrome/quinol oxidase subunit 2